MDTIASSDRHLLYITMRLTIAIIAGRSIGLDRSVHHKARELHTLLVSLDAQLFIIVPTTSVDRTNYFEGWGVGR
jgi:uncharacterized membrane protein YhiD involved in acid resistance